MSQKNAIYLGTPRMLMRLALYVLVLFLMACQNIETKNDKVVANHNDMSMQKEIVPVYWEVADVAAENKANTRSNVPVELKKRVMQYWQQFYRREWALNYQMETPENKKAFTEKSFAIYFRGGWQSKKIIIQSVSFKTDTVAIVSTKLVMEHPVTEETRQLGKEEQWEQMPAGLNWKQF